MTERINTVLRSDNTEPSEMGFPNFDPDAARKLKEEALEGGQGAEQTLEEETDPRYRFRVDKKDYSIFSQQEGCIVDEATGKESIGVLNIDETLGLMVGRTADLIATITGESMSDIPKIDNVIYLDKSARPVSWLVNEFWDDFTDEKRPETDYLAIDRRMWFRKVGIMLEGNEEMRDPDGTLRVAKADDFIEYFERMPEKTQKDWLARIRCLFIEGGIEDEDPSKILSTPTLLNNKNLLIVDEVSRSGSTLGIAKFLMKQAVPELASVNGYVFWHDRGKQVDGETQMGQAPVWYRHGGDNDWVGRGVKDIDPGYYRTKYIEQPDGNARAQNYGSFVLGVPMTDEDKEKEPGQASKKLETEIKRMRADYDKGYILPNLPTNAPLSDAMERIMNKLEGLGVVFGANGAASKSPNNYLKLMKIRDSYEKPRR